MRAVWSFWTKPHRQGTLFQWSHELYALFSWVLSVKLGERHFDETALYTDDYGARLLVDGLGLEFNELSTGLNILDNYNPEWWALGKILTYSMESKPFVHIDYDVYLWKTLPSRLTVAPIIGQNPEYIDLSASWYYPQKFELIKKMNGWVPREVEWYGSHAGDIRAVCCGIFGGNNNPFIQYYAQQVFKTLLKPENQPLWRFLGEDNILVEQYLLSACIDYYTSHPIAHFSDVSIEYLFQSADEAFDPHMAKERGFTHLIGGAKRNKDSLHRLENRVRHDYPVYYNRCRHIVSTRR